MRPTSSAAPGPATLRTMVMTCPAWLMRPGRDSTRSVTAPSSCDSRLRARRRRPASAPWTGTFYSRVDQEEAAILPYVGGIAGRTESECGSLAAGMHQGPGNRQLPARTDALP